MSADYFKEHVSEVLLVVTPKERPNHDWGGIHYQIKIDTDPNYASDDFDDPITLKECGSPKEPEISLYPEDAQALALALQRASWIRREAVMAQNRANIGMKDQQGYRLPPEPINTAQPYDDLPRVRTWDALLGAFVLFSEIPEDEICRIYLARNPDFCMRGGAAKLKDALKWVREVGWEIKEMRDLLAQARTCLRDENRTSALDTIKGIDELFARGKHEC